MLVAERVLTPKVAVVPLSVRVRREFALVSLIENTLLVPVPTVIDGLLLDKVNGLALDKSKFALEVAPLCVTVSKVSASVPVTVIVCPLTDTVFIPPPAMVTPLVSPLSEVTTLEVVRQVGQFGNRVG
jgi:hypothetical protein